MCLYPRFIRNKRYYAYVTKKPLRGTATAVPCDDFRKLYVPIGCGVCYECRRQKAQQWRVRLMEELKVNNNSHFITLTFSEENLNKLKGICGEDENKIAGYAIRHFLERYRKKYKYSLRHWFITELGHENTQRIHIHGIIFDKFAANNEELANMWQYGITDNGKYCNERTINYIIKYVLKVDNDHKEFMPKIYCSSGLGVSFVERQFNKDLYKMSNDNAPEYYYLNNGQKINLPIYYRNKFYTQEERNKLWTKRLNAGKRYVNGIEIDLRNEEGRERLKEVLTTQQEWNEANGYGKLEFNPTKYEKQVEEINKGQILANTAEN